MKSFLPGLFAMLVLPLLAVEPAFTTTASGLRYAITCAGDGATPLPGQVVIAHYTGTPEDGTVFDSSRDRQPFAFTLSRPAGPDGKGEIKRQVIPGWDEGFRLLRVGDRATFIIPPELAYRDKERGKIPANSTLCFDVELLGLRPAALSDHLREILETSGLEAAEKRYAELKAAGFADYHVGESQLNALGYRLMKDQPAAARAVLAWNAELFPGSANVYDSLGEVVLQLGDRAEARRLYERSLELNPKNENARKVLAELAEPPAAK